MFRYFPTILIVIMAVFNDGAMIALSKDKVVASRTPNSWNLNNIFIMGAIYGLYLTLSSWALYQVCVAPCLRRCLRLLVLWWRMCESTLFW